LPERVYIRLPDSQDQQILKSLKQALDEAQGSTEVILVLGSNERKQAIKLPTGISKEPPILDRLVSLVGQDNLKIV
jgi:hypothetical protein